MAPVYMAVSDVITDGGSKVQNKDNACMHVDAYTFKARANTNTHTHTRTHAHTSKHIDT